MKEVISPHARIVDPFAEKEGSLNMGNLAKTVLAGLGIHSAIDFFRNRKVDDTKQDKRDQDELKKIEYPGVKKAQHYIVKEPLINYHIERALIRDFPHKNRS